MPMPGEKEHPKRTEIKVRKYKRNVSWYLRVFGKKTRFLRFLNAHLIYKFSQSNAGNVAPAG